MLVVISDMHNCRAILELPVGLNVKELRKEYEAILYPGSNPWCHESDPPRQKEWIDKLRHRENYLVAKYGGETLDDGATLYSPLTFANWLVREKNAVSKPFREHCMVEFD